ncbi:hypothetical protein FOZ63_017332, partial [Perkinsus olseni]
FADALAPLHALVASQEKKFIWNAEAEKSVSTLKDHLDTLKLKQYAFRDLLSGTWACLIDASSTACGACLFHIDPSVAAKDITPDVVQNPNVSSLVSIMSHGFSASERRLHTYELESLVLVLSWRKWGKLWLCTARNRSNESNYETPNVVIMSDSMTAISRFDSYTVLDDPLSNIKARRFLSWIQELEETRFADILSRFHEQLDQQAEKRLIKPSVALGYALTAPGSCPVPDALRVNHLSLTPDQVTQLASLQ